MENLTLDEQYKFYLKKVNLDEAEMPMSQRVETKRAFVAGFSQMLIIMINDLGTLQREQQTELVNTLMRQCQIFWNNQK